MRWYKVFWILRKRQLLFIAALFVIIYLTRWFHFALSEPKQHQDATRMESRIDKVDKEYNSIVYSELRSKIADLEHKNAKQRQEILTLKKRQIGTEGNDKKKLRTSAKSQETFSEMVTVILYGEDVSNFSSCLESKENSLRALYPRIRVLYTKDRSTTGRAFNLLFPQVTTKYFLFLDSKHDLFEYSSSHSPRWLLDALENTPELVFVSGSLLNAAGQLEIPCFRVLLCNWTLSQRYEFERSIGEIMVCENIARTFMGRTGKVKSLFPKGVAFDENLPAFSHTDFFIRAKRAGAVSGIRPEVMHTATVHSSDTKCRAPAQTKRQFYESLLPFAHKHKVFRFKDPDHQMLDLCGDDSPILGEDICDEQIAHTVMLNSSHWAYDGTFAYPYIIRNLKTCLFKVTDFLASANVSYSIEGGVALGAIKLRGLLPWDAGDVDIFIYYQSLADLYRLVSEFARKSCYTATDKSSNPIQVYCVPKRLGTKMGGMVSLEVRDGNPPEFVRIKTDGRWIPYRKDIFSNLRHYYESEYLQHRMYASNEPTHCKKPGHNACLPDFRKQGGFNGKGGTFREFFCES